MITELFIGCFTLIEFINLVIRIVKLSPTMQNNQPELTEEMFRRLYSKIYFNNGNTNLLAPFTGKGFIPAQRTPFAPLCGFAPKSFGGRTPSVAP